MADLNILLVDDEPEVNTLMEMMLKNKAPGYSIFCAESGREALQLLKGDNIDCVLSDYQMPGMTGLDLLKELRDSGVDTPFIFVTGQGNEEVASEAFKDGASDYFTKDIGFAHFARIINSIEQAVSQQRARAAEARYQKEVLDYSRKLEVLTRASLVVNTVLETHAVMRRLVESAMELVGGGSGAAGQYIGGKMVFREYCRNGEWVDVDFVFEPGQGVPGHVMDTMAPYIANDAETDLHVVPEIQRELGFKNLIDVPIFDRAGKLLGCFEIHDKEQGGEFGERDVRLLEGLAASAATALDNSTLVHGLSVAKKEWEETFNAIDDLVTIHDKEFNIMQANKAASTLFGLDASSILGKKCYELFHQVGSPISGCPGEELLRGKVSIIPHEVTLGDKILEVNVYPLKGADDLRGFVHVAKDITERKQAEEASARYRKVLDTILESAQFGIMVVGRDKKIRRINRAALGIMGYDLDSEVIGRECHDNVCTAERGMCPVLDLGQSVDHSIRKVVDRSGNVKQVIKSVSPVMLGDEEVLLESFMELRYELKEAA